MTVEQVVFILFSAITLGAALLVVTWRSLFHAALFLILSFFGTAGLCVLLRAPLLAAVQFVYVGAIAVLIILTTVYTWEPASRQQPQVTHQWWAAVVVAALLCVVLGWIILSHDWGGDRRAGATTAVPLTWYLIVSATLFCLGLYGVLARRNGIAILMGVELMLNAANVNLVAFWRYLEPGTATGRAFALFVYAIAAAETIVGLALIIALWRTHGTVAPEDADLLKG